MPKGTKAEKAWEASRSAADNEYVRRLIEDEDLRENLQDAYRSAKKAYGRVNNGAPAKRLMDDKKVHRELKSAAESLREASDQLRGKRESHTFRNLVLLIAIVGGILAIALSRGPSQGGPGPPVRRRGGVRVHLDDDHLGGGKLRPQPQGEPCAPAPGPDLHSRRRLSGGGTPW